MRCCKSKARSRWYFLAEDRIIVARDPHGFRPLAMGRLEIPGERPATLFASETCAFDLIGATYINDVEPGEMVIVGPEGMTRERYTRPANSRALLVRTCIFFAAGFCCLREAGCGIA